MRICSITPHQLLNNPRIVREADALAAAGHDVRVIAVRKLPEQSARDAAIARGRRWRLQTIDLERTSPARWRWFATGVRQKAAKALWRRAGRGTRVAALAYARTGPETIRLAVGEPADLIIAHTQPMLAAASVTARRLGCRWGFDCEDILSEEYGEGIHDRAHQALIRHLEARFMPEADYVTVASSEFGEWLSEHYRIRSWTLVSNVPSRADAPPSMRPGYPTGRAHISLYWFSISVGPLRGLEDALRALPLVEPRARLHIRGKMLPGYGAELRALISALGVADRVVIHDLAAPEDVLRVAADHDIGLVLTQPCCENHELAVPNKIYAYMMAGLAVGATATRGHRSALAEAPGVGFEYRPGNYRELAEQINALARDPDRLHACRAEAFRLAQTRFNWEVEQHKLLDVVSACGHAAPRTCRSEARHQRWVAPGVGPRRR